MAFCKDSPVKKPELSLGPAVASVEAGACAGVSVAADDAVSGAGAGDEGAAAAAGTALEDAVGVALG